MVDLPYEDFLKLVNEISEIDGIRAVIHFGGSAYDWSLGRDVDLMLVFESDSFQTPRHIYESVANYVEDRGLKGKVDFTFYTDSS